MSKKNNVNFCGLGLNLWLIRQCEAIGKLFSPYLQKKYYNTLNLSKKCLY